MDSAKIPSEKSFRITKDGRIGPVTNRQAETRSDVLATPRARTQSKYQVNENPVFERVIDTASQMRRMIQNAFIRLSQSGRQLVESSLSNDPQKVGHALIELESFSQNPSPDVQVAVAVEISVLSRISKVWEEYKNELLAMWDSFYYKVEGELRNDIRGILDNGLGPPTICTREIAKKCSIYSTLNLFANIGLVEIGIKSGKSSHGMYNLPEGYSILDLSQENGIKKSLEDAGLIYNERTGLIKTAEGLKAMLFLGPGNKIIISFAGTEGRYGKSGTRLTRGMVANFEQNVLGKVPKIYSQSKNLVSILYEKFRDELVLTGFSQGGALAQYAGLSVPNATIPIMTFNSAGLAFGLLRELIHSDPSVIEKAKRSANNVSLEGELVDSLLRTGIGGVHLGNLHQIPIPKGSDWSSFKRHSIRQLRRSVDLFIETNPPKNLN